MSNNNIFFPSLIHSRIDILPHRLNQNIENEIMNIAKDKIEGKCVKEGFVQIGTLKIKKRSIGTVSNCHFTGAVTFDVIFEAKVCNPPKGAILETTIYRKNKLGFKCKHGPLDIIVPKEIHKNKDIFKNLDINNKVNIIVIGSKFNLDDSNIAIIGKLVNEKDINSSKIFKNKNTINNVIIKKEVSNDNEDFDIDDDELVLDDDDNTMPESEDNDGSESNDDEKDSDNEINDEINDEMNDEINDEMNNEEQEIEDITQDDELDFDDDDEDDDDDDDDDDDFKEE
jgi:DNA-directed RNA polymerase subunit E'/Rpb7